jgi:sigma-E factor negative regulatory protein RseC
MVEVNVPAGMAAKEAAVFLLVPVLGFVLGYILTGLFFPHSIDAARAAGGAAMLFIIAFICYFTRRRFTFTQPTVVANLST